MGRDGLASLWGEGAADAIRARECVAMPGNRKQEILTPPDILDPLRALWGLIAFDPCGTPLHTIAERTAYLEDDGLSFKWPDRTFVNPPYKFLKDWLAHFTAHSQGRACLLGPVRSHRKWWRAAARECSSVVYLDPLCFVGYSQAFPAPLCLMFRGEDWEDLEKLFGHLGAPV